MQALTHAVAVFCIACLCAELLTLFVPPTSVRAGRGGA